MRHSEIRRFLLAHGPGSTLPELYVIGGQEGFQESALQLCIRQLLIDRVFRLDRESRLQPA